ncbi:YcxB family protein [Limnobaculum zhutongyuii]|uniref:YcxB family protein n=1 Tax=Limnobaculum zhutongyuii TaxID=2498113 RepID=A0A411WGY3_9GAMM|nr:YcxB family protein [Limnobaculum zhutongyuii]QBH95505.1 YcxB family protein [Limnobaculum zhutongyuii]TQS88806.1 YcxB family protein [Limnobaculum zhutongyuii]
MSTDEISVTYTMSVKERVNAQEKIKGSLIHEKVTGYFWVHSLDMLLIASTGIAVVATLITFWKIYDFMENRTALYVAVGAFILSLFFYCIRDELFKSSMNKNESKEKAYAKYATTVTVHPDFICQGNDKYEARTFWHFISKIYLKDEFIFICNKENYFTVIPLRAFLSPEDGQNFIALAKRYLSEKGNSTPL